MALLARVRLALARRPWIHWLVVVGCAAMVWLSVHRAEADAQRAQHRWGSRRTVWVSTADTPAGAPLTLERRNYPIAVVPLSALTAAPTSAVAARAVGTGVIVVADDIATLRTPPTGWVVFALPADAAPSLRQGDVATVFGGGQSLCEGIVIAPAAAGASGGAATVEVAVAPRCGAPVGQQLTAHSIVLARALRSGP
jgi:hypothetical protein